MKICWFGAYNKKYPRNSILIKGLRERGVEIIECNAHGYAGFRKYVSLIKQIKSLQNKYDILYCAFPADLSVIVGKFFQDRPIVTDAFVSQYDTCINDREVAGPFSLKAFKYFFLDLCVAYFSDALVVDTYKHGEYWRRINKRQYIFEIPIGVDTTIFKQSPQARKSNRLIVQYHGTYIPVQGLEIILDSIKRIFHLPEMARVKFRFIGRGQLFKKITEASKKSNVPIEFIDYLETDLLIDSIDEADIVFGIFGNSEKANRAVPNKLYEGLAMRKAVITKKNEVMSQYFSDDEVYMVNNTPEALADAILELVSNEALRLKFGSNGYEKIVSHYSHLHVGKLLEEEINKLIDLR